MATGFFVKVWDKQGGILDGKPFPILHRLLVEDNTVHGFENLSKAFRTKQEVQMFFQMIMTIPKGTYTQLTWERE